MDFLIELIEELKKPISDYEVEWILTGSWSLKILGLIDRIPQDVDMIISCKKEEREEVFKLLKKTFSLNRSVDEHLIRTFILGKKIDIIVISRDVEVCPIEMGFKIATPYETLKIKATHTPEKYIKDLHSILEKISF